MNIDGLDVLISRLERLGNKEIADAALRSGLKTGALMVQATAKQLCPVCEGQLRNSIVVTELPDGVDIGTNVEYAVYQEYGTGSRGDPSVSHVTQKVSKVTGETYQYMGISPNPFMYPSLKANEQNVKNAVKERLELAIKGVTSNG